MRDVSYAWLMRILGRRSERSSTSVISPDEIARDRSLGAWIESQSTRNLHRPPWSGTEAHSKWCFYCGITMTTPRGKGMALRPTDRTLDHIVPRAAGGRGEYNFVECCSNCNGAKGDRSLLRFLLARPLMWRTSMGREL